MTRDYEVFQEVRSTREEILNCCYSRWYEILKEHTFPAVIIKPLPYEFLDYLGAESIRLPGGDVELDMNSDNEYSDWEGGDGSEDEGDGEGDTEGDGNDDNKEHGNRDNKELGNDDNKEHGNRDNKELGNDDNKEHGNRDNKELGNDDNKEHGNRENEEVKDVEKEQKQRNPVAGFQDLHNKIQQVFTKYKAIAPKLNWSAPKDSTWIMLNNTMKCTNANDVYLLLSSSDHITHDLDHPFEDSNGEIADIEYELVLRKWKDINPALEFRVFVRNGVVIGKSQRDLNYYDYLETLIDENNINHKINQFLHDKVIPKIPNKSFVIDVYIPRSFDKIYVIDINPFIRVTDSILYTWNELLNDQEDNIRLITETNLGRFKTKQYSENQVPLDVIQASCDPNALVELAKEWQINER